MFWVSVVGESVEKPDVHGQCLTSEDGAVSQTTSHRSACQLFSLLGLCFLFVISSSPFYHISWPMSFHPTVLRLCPNPFSRNGLYNLCKLYRGFTLSPRCTLYRDPPPSRSFLPYTELVFKSPHETCWLSCTSSVVSGNGEEAVAHLLGLKETVVSIDLQATFLPRGHAWQPQRWPPRLCFTPACVIRLRATIL